MGILTTVLTIVGAIIGGVIGGAPGAQIGALLGAFVGALIEGPPDVDPPDIQTVLAFGATEGDGMQRFMGTDVAISGELIWRGEQVNIPIKKHGEQIGWGYFLPIAVSFGRPVGTPPVLRLRELYAGDKLIYYSYEAIAVTGTDMTATKVEVYNYNASTGTTVVVQTYLDITTSTTNLADLHVGGAYLNSAGNITVAGWTGGATANNGVFLVVSVNANRIRLKNAASSTYAFATAASGDTIVLAQPAAEWYGQAGKLTIYYGDLDQTADPTIAAAEGAALTPAWPGLVYIVISGPAGFAPGFYLNDYGGTVPAFRARWQERTSTSLPEAIHDIAIDQGMTECEIDADDAVGVFRGYAWREPRSFPDLLAGLALVYNLVTRESDERLYVMHRLGVNEKTIPEAALAAQAGTVGAIRQRVDVERDDSRKWASQVSLATMDPDNGLEPGSETERRPALLSDVVRNLNLPITLDRDSTRKVAKRMLYAEEVVSERHKMTLPPSQLLTYESDRLLTSTGGRDRTTLVTRVARGQNFIMEVEGQREDVGLYANEEAIGSGTSGNGGQPDTTGDPQLRLADVAPLTADSAYAPTLWYGGVREGQGLGWNGAELHESTDGGSSYELIDGTLGEAAAGFVVGTLADGPVGYWDLGTTLTLDVFSQDAPASTTDAAVLSGSAGWWLCGGEVVGVVEWADLGNGRYAGTRLLRGLMDTADVVANHSPSETCVRLRTAGSLEAEGYSVGAIGQTRYYKATNVGGDPDNFTASTITLAGQSVRPFAPAYASGTVDVPAASDWTIAWEPRTRLPLWDIFGGQAFDDAETAEEYEIDVYDDDTFTDPPVRTITSTASGNGSVIDTSVEHAPTAIYDAADQSADLGGTQTTLYLRIFQVGQIAGQRSKAYEVTIT